ncbi:MAG TPA: hypothetical protein VFZ38_10670 [Vicinamibacterales bacterium]
MTLAATIARHFDRWPGSINELAEIYGTTPGTLSPILTQLRYEGVIRPSGRWDGKAPVYVGRNHQDPTTSGDDLAFAEQVDKAAAALELVLRSKNSAAFDSWACAVSSIKRAALAQVAQTHLKFPVQPMEMDRGEG